VSCISPSNLGSPQLPIFDAVALRMTLMTPRGNNAGDSSQPPRSSCGPCLQHWRTLTTTLCVWPQMRLPPSLHMAMTLASPQPPCAPQPGTRSPPSPRVSDSGKSSATLRAADRDEATTSVSPHLKRHSYEKAASLPAQLARSATTLDSAVATR
jgi:hypothetical protein